MPFPQDKPNGKILVKSSRNTASRTSRWKNIEGREFALPVAESDLLPRLEETPIDSPSTEIEPVDYPYLRVLLRDSGQTFRTKYRPTEAAELLETTPRTLRGWTSKGLVPYHREPSGTPYFSPQDIEDILTASARNGKETR
jgi:MerR HTH family regulatory protein